MEHVRRSVTSLETASELSGSTGSVKADYGLASTEIWREFRR